MAEHAKRDGEAKAKTKSCFVVMPIKKEGTPEHAHFLGLYENFLKPELIVKGYEVHRADEVQKAGSITKDIITRLATADLVVADLTDLNPNVFYELGARHALRSRGTIMLLDEKLTPIIPFDISEYRVVKFTSDIVSIGKLRVQLSKFVDQINIDSDHIDNPIHNWLPWLPRNAVDKSTAGEEARLREEIVNLRQALGVYERKYGESHPEESDRDSDPVAIIEEARLEAVNGTLPSAILDQARAACAAGDIIDFLDAVEKSFQARTFMLTPNQFTELAYLSDRFGADSIVTAIYAFACEKFPTSDMLRDGMLANLAHSERATDRERARRDISGKLGIRHENGKLVVSDDLVNNGVMFGIMLDAFDADRMHKEALELTTASVERFPNSSVLLRNHAKFLSITGQREEATRYHRLSALAVDANDTAFVWYGSELHNQGRYVDALESYVVACIQDPDDASNFGHVADEISRVLHGLAFSVDKNSRRLPEGLEFSHCVFAIRCAGSCESSVARAKEYVDRAIGILKIRAPSILSEIGGGAVSFSDRLKWAAELYEQLKSDVTVAREDEHVSGLRAHGA